MSSVSSDLQKKLGLTDKQAGAVTEEVLEPLKIYKQQFNKKVAEQGFPLGEKAEAELKKLQNYYEIKDEFVNLLKQEAEQQEAQKRRQREKEEAEKLRLQQQEAERLQQQPEAQRKLQKQQATQTTTTPTDTDDLSSEKGVDYTRLRDLLKAQKWKEADQETLAVMLKVGGREKEPWFDSESIENFPCTDLRTIDQLWVKYSNGRFGFSVQKRIWESVGKDLEKFGDRVGWLKYEKVVIEKWFGLKQQETNNARWLGFDDLTYNLSASEGHLPFDTWWFVEYLRLHEGKWWFSSLASRLVNCNI